MAEEQKTILIAEDEEDLRDMYTMALSGKGYEVLQAVNGIEALEWLERDYTKIDMILLDVVMPGMDGFETLKKIKEDERFKKIPIVVFTNLDNEEDKKQAFDGGADDYFVKSNHIPAELAAKLDLIFAKKAGK